MLSKQSLSCGIVFTLAFAVLGFARTPDTKRIDARISDSGAWSEEQLRIAVFVDSELSDEAARAILSAHGIDSASASPSRIAGVWIAAVGADGDARALGEVLASDPRVMFVSPLFLDEEGALSALTRDVIIKTKPGAGIDSQPVLRSGRGVTVSDLSSEELGSKRARVDSTNGYDVLDASVDLATNPQVEWAHPNRLEIPTDGLIYIIPEDSTPVTRYADGSQTVLENESRWRPMCGSDTANFSFDDLRTLARQTREWEAQAAAQAEPVAGAAAAGVPPQFDLVFVTSNLPAGAAAAIATVEAFIESQFTDPISATINLTFAPLGGGVLGGTSSQYTFDDYTDTWAGLQAGMDPNDDIQNHLPVGNTISIRYNGNSDVSINEGTVYFTRANYRATMGSISGTAASMTFNTNFSWDYTPPSISGGTWCFQSVLAHEVGHALGFTSGADFRNNDMEALDLYRFQRSDGAFDYNPDDLAEFTARPRMVDKDAPLLDDDAVSDIIVAEHRMSDGNPNQASHFREGLNGIMDPTLAPGQTFYPNFYRTADTNMFDAIGYEYPAVNTSCPAAREIGCNAVARFDNLTISGAPSPALSCASGGLQDGALWFQFTSTGNTATLSTCNSQQSDSTFAVYGGPDCDGLAELGCSEDGGCVGGGNRGTLCLGGLSPGTTYYVQFAAGDAGVKGSYEIDVDCFNLAAPQAEPEVNPKARYLSLTPGNTGQTTAIRVKLTDLAGFDSFDGQYRWVSPPSLYPETGAGSYWSAQLGCDPHYEDWAGLGIGVLHLYGAEVVPNSVYDVQFIHQCAPDINDEASYSAPLTIPSGEFGDVVGPYGGAIQPDFADISAVVSKFQGQAGAPIKVRTQQQPNVPDQLANVGFLDISACVSSFQGMLYPYPGPSNCPP